MAREKRNLDGAYFRVKRGDKYEDICFSDMELYEIDEVIGYDRPAEWWKSLALHLKERLNTIGDTFDIIGE